MEGKGRYGMSLLGEFLDKALEREFFHYDMRFFSRHIGPVALIFGAIYMLFIIPDYFAVKSASSFMDILVIRILFLSVSAAVYFIVRKITDYSKLAYLITAYELWAVISFMLIIYKYESIGVISFFSVMAITLAIYITPNRFINAQIISVLFNLSYCILFAYRVDDAGKNMLWQIASYTLIFIIFGNIEAYLANSYRRKHFTDSRELLRLSATDSLTGIYNRNRFDQELNRWVDYCNIYNNPLSLAIFDIDDFKSVNDSHGHLAGDSILQNIASIIKDSIRRTDIFARWGGEEFVILLPNTDIRQALEMAERMRVCIEENKYGSVENVTCSFGLVSLQKNEDAGSFLQRADNLLYEAKKQGKNTVVCDAYKAKEQGKAGSSGC